MVEVGFNGVPSKSQKPLANTKGPVSQYDKSQRRDEKTLPNNEAIEWHHRLKDRQHRATAILRYSRLSLIDYLLSWIKRYTIYH